LGRRVGIEVAGGIDVRAGMVAFELNRVAPALLISSWSFQVPTTTGGCEGCVGVR